MKHHPCSASRYPLKGAALAVRPSRPGGASRQDPFTRCESHTGLVEN
jgi:hypothetical protein